MERQPLLAGGRHAIATEVALADVPELLGVRVFHLNLIFVICLLESVTASIFALVPYILGDLIWEYGIARHEVALVHSSMMFGAVLGALTTGLLSDRYGRKTCLSCLAASAALLALVHFVLPGGGAKGTQGWFIALLVLRFLLGICFGGILAGRFPYILEFVADTIRGRMTGIGSVGHSLTTALCILVAKHMEVNWRVLLATPVVLFGSICFVVLCFFPESVRWLFVNGHEDEGYKAIRYILSSKPLFGEDQQLPGDSFQVVVPKACADQTTDAAFFSAQLRSLLGHKWRQTTIVASLLFIATAGSTYAAALWTPYALKKLLGAETHMYELFIWAEVVSLVTLLVVTSIVDWAGRKPSYVCTAIAAALCWATFPLAVTYGNLAIYVNVLSTSFFMTINWTTLYTYITEVFPTPLRGTGAGFAACFGRISAALMPIGVGATLGVSITWGFWLIGLIMLAGAVAAAFMPQEMANSKLRDEV